MRAHRDKSPATYRLVIDNGECSDSCHTDVLASLGGHCPISPLLQKQRKDEQGLWQLKAYAAAAKSCLKGCRQKYFLAPAGPGSPTRASRGGWKSARSCSQQARFWLAGTQCSGAREKRCGEKRIYIQPRARFPLCSFVSFVVMGFSRPASDRRILPWPCIPSPMCARAGNHGSRRER
jgi:hypothetical protein